MGCYPIVDAILKTTMLKALRFLGLLVLHLLVALIRTTIVDTALWKALPTHTVVTVLWKEVILSVVCAAAIGLGMWRTWRSEPAKWTWVLTTLWFCFGLAGFAGRGIWGPLSADVANFGAGQIRAFFIFTIPMIRGVSYSMGALIGSLVYHRAVVSVEAGTGI